VFPNCYRRWGVDSPRTFAIPLRRRGDRRSCPCDAGLLGAGQSDLVSLQGRRRVVDRIGNALRGATVERSRRIRSHREREAEPGFFRAAEGPAEGRIGE
jgi:hypothetical protein